ncbi:MAG: L-lactate dehydrogenase, partial [Oscillospiraceae bacterium]|nr:L-lactate dehydrogenase [Oscillospiraceae bacterium]
LCRVVDIVLHDEKAIMPASMELCGEYGVSGLFAGVPCIIGSNGVEEIIQYNLPEEELKEFKACCDSIKHNMTMDDTVIRY